MEKNFVELSSEEELKWREIHQIEPQKFKERCEYCKKPVYQIVKAPKEIEVEIWKWTTTCWNCKSETPVVWPEKELSGYTWESMTPQTFNNLPLEIQKIYPFFKIVEKRTMKVTEHGNTCSQCGAYQGDWFMMEDLMEISYSPEGVEKKQINVQLTDDEQLFFANPKCLLKMHSPKKGSYRNLCDSCFALHKKKQI